MTTKTAAPQRGVRVLYEGRVQGIGFRFTVVEIAAQFAVTGYVQNLSDGSVEVLAEGQEDELNRFLLHIRQSRVMRYVTGEHAVWQNASGRYHGFDIRYG